MRKLSALFVVVALLFVRPSRADEPEQASTHFNRGVTLYKMHSFDGALAEFKRAYEISPKTSVLFNIGQLEYEIHEFAHSIKTLEQYLAEAGESIPADKRATATDLLNRSKQLIAHVDLTAGPSGLVTLDETSLGQAPLKLDLAMDPGKHRFTLTRADAVPVTRTLLLASGDHAMIDLQPAIEAEPQKAIEASSAPLPSTPAEKAAAAAPKDRTPAYVLLGTTAVLLAGTVTTAILTVDAQHALDRQYNDIPYDPVAVRDRRSDVKTAGVVTDILGLATIASGVVTTYLFISSSSSSPSKTPSRSAYVSVGPTSLGFGGTFQ